MLQSASLPLWDSPLAYQRAGSALSSLSTDKTVPAPAGAAAQPQYRSSLLDIPGVDSVTVTGINDAGQIVGNYVNSYATDAAFKPFVWDAAGKHDLALPPGIPGAAATSINNSGQIIGWTLNSDATIIYLLQWNASAPDVVEIVNTTTTYLFQSAKISDSGVVVGGGYVLSDFSAHSMVWSADSGIVDYGTPVPANPAVGGTWNSINASGRLVGSWTDSLNVSHAAVGQLGTPSMQAFSAQTDAVASGIAAINSVGTMVGFVNVGSVAMPAVFNADGTLNILAGAMLGQSSGRAIDINDAGDIVGYATATSATDPNTFFVDIEGSVHNPIAASDFDGSSGIQPSTPVAINNHGTIIGVGFIPPRIFYTRSFVLTRITDRIFSDGFEMPSP
jgi:hypothetical protein